MMGVEIVNHLPRLAKTLQRAVQSLFDESAEQWVQEMAQATPHNAIGHPYIRQGWYLVSASGISTYQHAATRLAFVTSSLRSWFHGDPTEWFALSPAHWFRGIPTDWWLSPRLLPPQSPPSFPGVTVTSATEWTAMNEQYGVPFVNRVANTLTLSDTFESHWRSESGVSNA